MNLIAPSNESDYINVIRITYYFTFPQVIQKSTCYCTELQSEKSWEVRVEIMAKMLEGVTGHEKGSLLSESAKLLKNSPLNQDPPFTDLGNMISSDTNLSFSPFAR